MLAVFKRELTGFLSSMVAYITIGVFLLVTGLFLWVFPETSIFEYGYAGLDSFFSIAPYLFMFLIPAITMRSFAEEKREGTFEFLVTRPLTDWQIVWGKYFACLALVLLALLPSLVYYYTVNELGMPKGNIDGGAVFGSYIGLFLLGGTFVAMGIFASSVTKNQVIAFTIAVFLSFVAFSGLDAMSKILSLQSIESIILGIGINAHYQSISRGVLDSRDLVYFLSFITLFLLITRTILGGRKW